MSYFATTSTCNFTLKLPSLNPEECETKHKTEKENQKNPTQQQKTRSKKEKSYKPTKTEMSAANTCMTKSKICTRLASLSFASVQHT